MTRPKKNDYPRYMRPDGDRGGFIVENPVSGKKKRFGIEHEQDARGAAVLVGKFVEQEKLRKLLEAGRPTLDHLIERWRVEWLPKIPWDESTRSTAENRIDRISREVGATLLQDADVVFIGEWLSKTAPRADPFNKWRYIWVLLYKFAVEKKLCPVNEAEKVQARSTSRKLKANRKKRQQLDIQGFRDIHAQAPAWLQIAMEGSLMTVQSRREIVSMQHSDFRDGWLYIIRDKVAADSDMAFIRIKITPEIEAWRLRAAKTDNIVCPFLIHRRPERMQRRWMQGKKHWAYVNDQYLSKAFLEARDKVPRFAALPERERPTFHEIRGLGGRLMRRLGLSKAAISDLMTHSDEKTTEIYLELGAQALTDDHFFPVSAPFGVEQLLAVK